ncbi:putative ankyrin repeats (many copies) [Lyophyllum shimeji]|uniref:Ankyrin repeats (Many copies) n=1 Tax=Lyophyllum shimeji TaxID=47721 RepID=A0A9P3PXF8_LYOSH|nr:putative ankyrin repeats (many copies) [Lyophyllum shimeji]
MSNISAHAAAQNQQLTLLRSLLSEDPKAVNSLDQDQRTPLHWAASSGAVDIVRFLIHQNAEVDKPDISGWTPLHIAVSAGNDEVVHELVGAGADVNRKNDKGLTPLHYAASKSRIDIGRFLISRGADINAKDNAGQLPLHRAATTGSVGFIRLLLEPSTPGATKARLNTADRIGNTPLHLAMESAHAEAAVLLINAGADRGRLNQEGEAPEDVQGVGGSEQKQARQHVIDVCGKP